LELAGGLDSLDHVNPVAPVRLQLPSWVNGLGAKLHQVDIQTSISKQKTPIICC
jgi:hypothetical protein